MRDKRADAAAGDNEQRIQGRRRAWAEDRARSSTQRCLGFQQCKHSNNTNQKPDRRNEGVTQMLLQFIVAVRMLVSQQDLVEQHCWWLMLIIPHHVKGKGSLACTRPRSGQIDCVGLNTSSHSNQNNLKCVSGSQNAICDSESVSHPAATIKGSRGSIAERTQSHRQSRSY